MFMRPPSDSAPIALAYDSFASVASDRLSNANSVHDDVWDASLSPEEVVNIRIMAPLPGSLNSNQQIAEQPLANLAHENRSSNSNTNGCMFLLDEDASAAKRGMELSSTDESGSVLVVIANERQDDPMEMSNVDEGAGEGEPLVVPMRLRLRGGVNSESSDSDACDLCDCEMFDLSEQASASQCQDNANDAVSFPHSTSSTMVVMNSEPSPA